jgi:hypothetical protein
MFLRERSFEPGHLRFRQCRAATGELPRYLGTRMIRFCSFGETFHVHAKIAYLRHI